MVGPFVEVEDHEAKIAWRFETSFLTSNWTCIWGRGCKGILEEPAESLNQGCCSVGAEILDQDEARRIVALAASADPEFFQFHAEAQSGVLADSPSPQTKLVDGACIFLNRPGFAGGEGCALHILAIQDSCSPIDYKPSVCWQLPIKIDWCDMTDGWRSATLRAWRRSDWGSGGSSMAWCCTEDTEAYCSDKRVVDSLKPELQALIGEKVYVELRGRLPR